MNADESLMAVSYNNSSSPNTIIELYDTASRKMLYRWEASKASRADLNFTPDGKKLVICKINDFKTWDIFVCSTIDYSQKHYSMRGKYPNYLIGSDSETIYAVESPDDCVVIRELTSGRVIATAENDWGWTEADVYFSRSGDLAVLSTTRQEGAGGTSAGRFVYECFDLKTGKSLFKTTEGTDYIGQVAFSSDGNFVAIHTAGEKICRLWDVNTGTKTEILSEEHIMDMAFTPDNSSLILAENGAENDAENTCITFIKLYNAQETLSRAKALLKDTELTSDEKVRYFVSD